MYTNDFYGGTMQQLQQLTSARKNVNFQVSLGSITRIEAY